MPNDLKLIFKILKYVRQSIITGMFDESKISAESLGISEPFRNNLMKILVDSEYLTGVTRDYTFD